MEDAAPAPLPMVNVPERRWGLLAEPAYQAAERDLLAAELLGLLRRLPAAYADSPREERETAEREVLERLREVCKREICLAILDNPSGAGLCGVYLDAVWRAPDGRTVGYDPVLEDANPIHSGIGDAAGSVALRRGTHREHVRSSMKYAIARRCAALSAEYRLLGTRPLLDKLTSISPVRAYFVVEHLSGRQRRLLRERLYRELGEKSRPVIVGRPPRLPTKPTRMQHHQWLYWCLWSGILLRNAGGFPGGAVGIGTLALVDSGPRLTDKNTGEPVDPLAPIHTKAWSKLSRELNVRGLGKPTSERGLARSFGVSRGAVRRFEEAGIPVDVSYDGKGGVSYEFSANAASAALEATGRKKRADARNGGISDPA